MAHLFYQQWYGYVEFDPVAYGSQLMTPETPALRRFVEWQVDRSIKEAAAGQALERNPDTERLGNTGSRCYYTDNGRLTREQAIEKEYHRLLDMWNGQWSHHLNADDVKALVEDDRLSDFTRRPLPGIPLEEYIRTRAYYLWVEAGRPDGRADEFWNIAAEEHDGHWLPFWNGYMPTPEEVNAWSIGGFGHDSINCHVCIKARCEREGWPLVCDVCGGSSRVWQPAEAEQWAEDWERTEPPAGEGYQIWETVSEGSPISPVFSDPRILAEWMANSPWGADDGITADQWLKFILGAGLVPVWRNGWWCLSKRRCSRRRSRSINNFLMPKYGMGKFSFIRWLALREDTTPQQQAVELQVARFLEDILEKAAALKKQDLQVGNRKSFTDYVRQVWPREFIQDTNFLLPNIFPPDIAGKPVQFKLKLGHNAGDTIHDQGVFDGFVFNMMPFNKANTPEEVDAWLDALKSTVHHEAEHIYNVGGEYDHNDYEGDDKHKMAMQYMNNPGELRAHARQMAYLYAKHFPGEPFDLAKSQSVLDKPIFTNTMRNYFSSFAKPEVWQKNVEKFGYKHANPHDQIMALVPQFLPQYQG